MVEPYGRPGHDDQGPKSHSSSGRVTSPARAGAVGPLDIRTGPWTLVVAQLDPNDGGTRARNDATARRAWEEASR